jgi:hypothetical protein
VDEEYGIRHRKWWRFLGEPSLGEMMPDFPNFKALINVSFFFLGTSPRLSLMD